MAGTTIWNIPKKIKIKNWFEMVSCLLYRGRESPLGAEHINFSRSPKSRRSKNPSQRRRSISSCAGAKWSRGVTLFPPRCAAGDCEWPSLMRFLCLNPASAKLPPHFFIPQRCRSNASHWRRCFSRLAVISPLYPSSTRCGLAWSHFSILPGVRNPVDSPSCA